MKKLFMTLCIVLVSVGAFAQKGTKAVGVNVGYGTEISNVGIGVKGQYGITDAIRVEASFDYFLKKDYTKMWDINLNAHYLFNITDKFKVYPLVGLTYSHWGFDFGSFGDYDWPSYASTRASLEGWSDGDDGDDGDSGSSSSGSSSSGKFGVNLGGGVQYDINSKWAVNFEIKYQLISDFSQAVFGLGIAYKL